MARVHRSIPFAMALAVAVALTAGGIGQHLLEARTPTARSFAPSALPDSSLLAALKWRNVGPDRGGRSIAVSGVKGRPKEAYFGAVGGGLWKTSDGGETWAPVTDGQVRAASVGAAGAGLCVQAAQQSRERARRR